MNEVFQTRHAHPVLRCNNSSLKRKFSLVSVTVVQNMSEPAILGRWKFQQARENDGK